MAPDDLIDQLATLPLFKAVPRTDLEWLAERGEVQTYASGSVLREQATPVDEMMVLISGRVGLYAAKGGGLHRIVEGKAGDVVGAIPYSRMQKAPGRLVIEEDTVTLSLLRSHFPDLIRECPETTAALVHHMIDRARGYRAVELEDDRIQSLSRLASGLAHELNNPAAAAARDARALAGLLDEAEQASRTLAGARLSDVQLAAIDVVRGKCGSSTPRSALETAVREDDISEWLDRRGLASVPGETLAESEVGLSDLDQLAAVLPPEALRATLHWMAVGNESRDAARQIESATQRIHALVSAVKGFTFLDREAVAEEVNVERGLSNTLTVLESKTRAKSVDVRLETADALPPVYGFGSEINQVWQKLIDNAIDAVGTGGKVTVTAAPRGDDVIVRVEDDGPGIPDENLSRVFDPFFTTKPVGSGTGLGLDFARRIVHLHHGDIEVKSQPGRTVFRVRLPISGARGMS